MERDYFYTVQIAQLICLHKLNQRQQPEDQKYNIVGITSQSDVCGKEMFLDILE